MSAHIKRTPNPIVHQVVEDDESVLLQWLISNNKDINVVLNQYTELLREKLVDEQILQRLKAVWENVSDRCQREGICLSYRECLQTLIDTLIDDIVNTPLPKFEESIGDKSKRLAVIELMLPRAVRRQYGLHRDFVFKAGVA